MKSIPVAARLRPPNEPTRRIAPQAPCSGGLRPPMGNDSALTETPLQLKTSLSLRAAPIRHPLILC